MGIYRSYFKKNNTIISETEVNSAKNPVTELFYGGDYSRFIFQPDFEGLLRRISEGEIQRDRILNHKLIMYNTINPNENSYFNGITGINTQRTVSFDLKLTQLYQHWDEGTGYDYVDTEKMFPFQHTFSVNPSNWFNATTLDEWLEPGGFLSGATTLGFQHFDNGSENLEIDITNYVNDILDGLEQNMGMGLSFDRAYEEIQGLDIYQSVAFFTKYTQTYFEPFVETTYDDYVYDNRDNFIECTDNKLYLITTKNGKYINLDNEPDVQVYNNQGNMVFNTTSYRVRKGIYAIDINLCDENCDYEQIYNDVWTNVRYQSRPLSDIKQEFVLRPSKFVIDSTPNEYNQYDLKFKFNGISKGVKINKGDIKKVIVNPIIQFGYDIDDFEFNFEYKIYTKEGQDQIDVIDWSPMNKLNGEHHLVMDTEIFISNKEYYLAIKMSHNNMTHTFDKEVMFYVVNKI